MNRAGARFMKKGGHPLSVVPPFAYGGADGT